MKRFVLALPVVAAWVLFCLPAFAGDAAILPEPDVLKVPWWMPLIGVLIAGFRTFFSDNTRELPTIVAGWRTAIVAVLAALGTLIEQLVAGFDGKTAVLTFVMLGVPSILQEILKALFSGKKTGGSGKAMFPPAIIGAMALLALTIAGCAAKGLVCPALRIAADACETIIVVLPDGSEERIPKSAVVGMAMQARAARISGAKASDAGAE